MRRTSYHPTGREAGTAAVEFAVIAIVFFTLIFAVLELARAMYMFNTLQEVTRRAAAAAVSVNFHDDDELANVREQAIFRNAAGTLVLGDPVTPDHVRIDYMSVSRSSDGTLDLQPIAPSSLPGCPAANRQICLADPNDSRCIRFVRVRICEPGDAGSCDRVPYKSLVSGLISLPVNLPRALTLVPAGSLGYTVGTMPCS